MTERPKHNICEYIATMNNNVSNDDDVPAQIEKAKYNKHWDRHQDETVNIGGAYGNLFTSDNMQRQRY